MSSDVKSSIPQVDNSLPMPSENTSNPPRQNLIETAVKFLQNPQVQSSSISARRAFLIKKGLTEKEIDIALERSGVNTGNQIVPYAAGTPAPQPQQLAPYHPRGWRGYTALAVVLGSVAYCIYKFYQNVIAPLLRRRKEELEALKAMEDAVNELKSSVSETVNEVQKMVNGLKITLDNQEQKLDQLTLDVARNKTMAASVKSIDTGEIKSELVSLKGLLLSRNQFPRTPKPSPIPAWQMTSTTNGEGDATETTAPPAAEPSAVDEPANGVTNRVDEHSIEADQVSEMIRSLEETTPQSSQPDTPSQTDGKIVRSLSGSFEGTISPSKMLHGATAHQNGDVPINGHLVSGENFTGLNDQHDDSNKSDDSVD